MGHRGRLVVARLPVDEGTPSSISKVAKLACGVVSDMPTEAVVMARAIASLIALASQIILADEFCTIIS